jgi:hypothetical protein
MAHSDWIPRREQDLIDLVVKWVAMLADAEKRTTFGWDVDECLKTVDILRKFLAAREKHQKDNSSANRLTKDEAKEAAVDAMRDFANTFVRPNKKMTDADKLVLGIRRRNTTNTCHGTPASQPITVVENTVKHYAHLYFLYFRLEAVL